MIDDPGFLVETDMDSAELAAMVLGNALLFRAVGTEDDVPVLAVLKEVFDLTAGQTLSHTESAALIAPILDRLLAMIQAQTNHPSTDHKENP